MPRDRAPAFLGRRVPLHLCGIRVGPQHANPAPVAAAAAGDVGGRGSEKADKESDLKEVFEKHGIADICERVCEELGAKLVSDLELIETEDVDGLTWLKPIERRVLLKLVADARGGSRAHA